MGVENSIPDFRDGNWRPVFPGIPGIGNSRSWLPDNNGDGVGGPEVVILLVLVLEVPRMISSWC